MCFPNNRSSSGRTRTFAHPRRSTILPHSEVNHSEASKNLTL
jgi:hypothetical protein